MLPQGIELEKRYTRRGFWLSIQDSDDKQALVAWRVWQAGNPGSGAGIPGERKAQAMARIVQPALEVEDLEASDRGLQASGSEILSPAGELPVKFLDVRGVVAALVAVGRYKTP